MRLRLSHKDTFASSEKVMVNSEREMVRQYEESPKEERFTSLQPTYEDSVPPETEWELEQDY